jgi:hypothetical protein
VHHFVFAFCVTLIVFFNDDFLRGLESVEPMMTIRTLRV